MSRSTAKNRTLQRARRHRRIRVVVKGTALRPRISVFRSNMAVTLQLIDDASARTLAAASTREVKGENALKRSFEAGRLLAERAKAAGITAAVFDRSGYVYAGRVKAAAEGARGGGLAF